MNVNNTIFREKQKVTLRNKLKHKFTVSLQMGISSKQRLQLFNGFNLH